MQEEKTPLIIYIKDGQFTVDFGKLSEVLLEACDESAGATGKNCGIQDHSYNATNHNSLEPQKYLIVTAVGPPCSGKSFLLNWVAKYFTANGERTWTAGNATAALEGFGWNPYPEDKDSHDSCEDGPVTGGIRVFRTLPTLYKLIDYNAENKVGESLKIILLDIDLSNEKNNEFGKYYSTLVAMCVLMSTLAIYIDTGDDQKDLYDLRTIFALLGQELSDPRKNRPEIVYLMNRHFEQHHFHSNATGELLSLCMQCEIPLAQHGLPSLRKAKHPAHFQGALEHMDKDQLKLAMTRMAAVDGLVGRTPQSAQEIFKLIRDVLDRINEIIKPDVWEQLSLGPPPLKPPSEPQPAPPKVYSKSVEHGQNGKAPEDTGRIPHELKIVEDTYEVSIGQLDTAPLKTDETSCQTGIAEISVSVSQIAVGEENLPTPGPPYEATGVSTTGTLRSKPRQQPETGLQPNGVTSDHTRTPPKQKEQQTQTPRAKSKVFEKQRDIDEYITKICFPQFTHLLLQPKHLQCFVVSSMLRVEVAQLIKASIFKEYFQGHPPNVKIFALRSLDQSVSDYLQRTAYVSEAIDKGRNMIGNEFSSEVFLDSNVEIDRLIARAKKFSLDRFKPQPGTGHETLFEMCWEAISENTKLRNEKIRRHEFEINTIAVGKVVGLYSEELTRTVGDASGELSHADLVRIPQVNDELVTDCLEILIYIKDYQSETENVKRALKNEMAKVFQEKIGKRIQHAHTEKQKQLEVAENKPKQKELEKKKKVEDAQTKQKELEEQQGLKEPTRKRVSTSGKAAAASSYADKNTNLDASFGANTNNTVSHVEKLSTRGNVAQASDLILVIHIGRNYIVKFVPLDRIPQECTPIQIPAYIAFASGEFVIGEKAKGIPGAISLQDVRAGPQTYRLHNEEMRREQVVGLFLSRSKMLFEKHVHQIFTSCLLVIPAICSSIDRQAIFDSASLAGFTKVILITEPTAVAFDYYCTKYVKANATGPKDLAVVYFGGNGHKELALYKFSPPQWKNVAVQMNGLSGSLFLPYFEEESFLRKLWNLGKSPSEYKQYAHDANSAASTSVDKLKVIVAGDCDELVKRELKAVDINKGEVELIKHNFSESAIDGAALLAGRVLRGEQLKNLMLEKYAFPIVLKYSTDHKVLRQIFKRNADFGSVEYMDILNENREIIFDLVSDAPEIQLGTYRVQRDPSLSIGSTIKCSIQISLNGGLRVSAKFKQGTQFNNLQVERVDDLNVNPETMEKYRQFAMLSIRNSQEYQEKAKVKAELRDYLHHAEAQLQYTFVKRNIKRWNLLQAEISKTKAVIANDDSGLEILREKLLSLTRIISGDK